jgi:hypothetical protein
MKAKRIKPVLSVTIDADLKAWVQARAIANRETPSQVINKLLADAYSTYRGETKYSPAPPPPNQPAGGQAIPRVVVQH